MPDPVATFAEANQAKQAAERGGMEVIATAGPTNLADTGTLSVDVPAAESIHNVWIEVSGDNTSTSSSQQVNLDSLTNLALRRQGAWITAPASETLANLPAAGSVGDTVTATFLLDYKQSGTLSNPSVQVKVNGAVDQVQLRILAIRNP